MCPSWRLSGGCYFWIGSSGGCADHCSFFLCDPNAFNPVCFCSVNSEIWPWSSSDHRWMIGAHNGLKYMTVCSILWMWDCLTSFFFFYFDGRSYSAVNPFPTLVRCLFTPPYQHPLVMSVCKDWKDPSMKRLHPLSLKGLLWTVGGFRFQAF